MCSFAFFPFFLNSTTVLHRRPARYKTIVKQYKDLGIIVQRDISWSVHISKICAKAYKSLHLIRRTVSSTSPQIKLNLYFSLVWSKTHILQLWRPHLIKDITCLERVQHRATKFVLNDFTSNYKSRLTSLNLFPLMYWLKIQDLMFLIKCIKYPPDNLNIIILSYIFRLLMHKSLKLQEA